ncbi:hypothetical protein GTU75_08125 [Erysipelothrix rhusiopathiae]|nr:hypothetical protein [Erysipelothrix rhusiopathiae]
MSQFKTINRLIASFLAVAILSVFVTVAYASNWSSRLDVHMPPWGKWSSPTHGLKKNDNLSGQIHFISTSTWFTTYGDLWGTHYGYRASKTYYPVPYYDKSGERTQSIVNFSYSPNNEDWNGYYVSARMSSSDYEPNWNIATIEFSP